MLGRARHKKTSPSVPRVEADAVGFRHSEL